MGLILDTNFIVTAEREARRGKPGKVDAFLSRRPEENLFLTFTVAGELACGESASARQAWQRLCQPFPILKWTLEVSWQYGELYRTLAPKGRLIGTNDMWIAATALAYGHGVVTNNYSEFNRIPRLLVERY